MAIKPKVPEPQKLHPERKISGLVQYGKACPACPFVKSGKTVTRIPADDRHISGCNSANPPPEGEFKIKLVTVYLRTLTILCVFVLLIIIIMVRNI